MRLSQSNACPADERNATQQKLNRSNKSRYQKNKNKKAASEVSGFNIAMDLVQGLRMNFI